MKRFFAFLLVCIACLSIGTLLAGCGEVVSQGLEFTLTDNDTAYGVSGIGTCTDVDVIIPSTHNGKPVKSIEYGAFQNNSSLKSISIPDSITFIEERAFNNCTSLERVTIGNGVKTIGEFAFWYCTSLTSVNMGNGIETIGRSAFEDCTSLESITIPDSVKIIDRSAFADCTLLESVSLGNSVVEIGDYAFKYSRTLKNITIPDSIKIIGADAFYDCNLNLNEHDNAYYLGNATNPHVVLLKAKSKNIATCEIHQDTKLIYIHAFYDCTSLGSVTIPDSVNYIESCAFTSCSSLKSITIPDNVTYIGNSAFAYCTELVSITFENTVGWQTYTNSSTDTTSMDVTNPITNATNLVSNSYNCHWRRNA